MARRNMRAAINREKAERRAPPRKAAAKKKKKAPAKRPKAALSKGYWEALERIERLSNELKAGLHEVKLALEALQKEVTARDDLPNPAGTSDEAGD